MPTTSITFDLDQPPETVFDYIADIRNESEWSKDMKSAVLVGDGPLGDGSVFETEYRMFGKMRIVLSERTRSSAPLSVSTTWHKTSFAPAERLEFSCLKVRC